MTSSARKPVSATREPWALEAPWTLSCGASAEEVMRARLENLAQRYGDKACHPWPMKVSPRTGYGVVRARGIDRLAHRFAYEVTVGPIPDGMVIDHVCGYRPCVNPAHLEVVTQQENCKRGRGTKLTDEQVAEIRAFDTSSLWGYAKHLARKYGVSPSYIYQVRRGAARAQHERGTVA